MDTNVFAAPIVSTRIVQKIEPLARSLAFYQNLFGLNIVERPPFKNAGAWLACGAMQVHLILHPAGSFRIRNVDNEVLKRSPTWPRKPAQSQFRLPKRLEAEGWSS